MDLFSEKIKIVSDYIKTATGRAKLVEKWKESYTPQPCEICGKPMTYEEASNMYMCCSVNPEDRFCGETVFCCDSHNGQERFAFVLNRRKIKDGKK